jgi:hypothetical protein
MGQPLIGKTTGGDEHCDWCGDILGSVRRWIKADWRGEYLRVHPHCVNGVLVKNANISRAPAIPKDPSDAQ